MQALAARRASSEELMEIRKLIEGRDDSHKRNTEETQGNRLEGRDDRD